MKKTLELYGTLGPADHSTEILNDMFQAGMTGLRLNLSHTNLADCEPWLENLYAVAEKRHIVPDLLVDLQGPEVRIGILKEPLPLSDGSAVRLCPIAAMAGKSISSPAENERFSMEEKNVSSTEKSPVPARPGSILRPPQGITGNGVFCRASFLRKSAGNMLISPDDTAGPERGRGNVLASQVRLG